MFRTLAFYTGEEIVVEERLKALGDMGYSREPKASSPSTYSFRGGILDVFPWGFSHPVRMELAGDRVETIHTFDPVSGAGLASHEMVVILSGQSQAPRPDVRKTAWRWGEKPLEPYVDIHSGDLVVHVLHGIARYRGIEKLKDDKGRPRPHLALEFQDAEKLYVPLTDLHLVQRYLSLGTHKGRASKEGRDLYKSVPLSKLGSKVWQKLREKARKGIFSYASQLLELQAKRSLAEGFAFGEDHEWQAEMEKRFPFEETPDQIKAIEEVKADMKSSKPMDRLICGDVGFGKTEVALRAVFKAVTRGKQAAILVPTTLLCEQHFETMKERFADFPLRVEMLSRFRTGEEQKAVIGDLAAGKVDAVVGTHRLLSDDIAFKDLGLLVIDEEQRFGVKHKEKLKRFRVTMDVLSMTATPIPRTLYMSLVGGKDMSLIATPPTNRLPIVTRVTQSDDRLLREAIMNEIARQGQVFFIHNRVEGIETLTEKLRRLVPEARIRFAHGQMAPKVLEEAMRTFIHHQVDVLVCTTIVQSGIDIPNANTLIVNRADHFGLSELYQLKGRVGRFNREAYAYFLVPRVETLTHESQRRLQAIEKHHHLGAGFSIAMEDLEIRGAGNILGTQQSGFVAHIGFDLYCRLLREAIETLKKKR